MFVLGTGNMDEKKNNTKKEKGKESYTRDDELKEWLKFLKERVEGYQLTDWKGGGGGGGRGSSGGGVSGSDGGGIVMHLWDKNNDNNNNNNNNNNKTASISILT